MLFLQPPAPCKIGQYLKITIRSRELTYPTWGKGKSSSEVPLKGICKFPGGKLKISKSCSKNSIKLGIKQRSRAISRKPSANVQMLYTIDPSVDYVDIFGRSSTTLGLNWGHFERILFHPKTVYLFGFSSAKSHNLPPPPPAEWNTTPVNISSSFSTHQHVFSMDSSLSFGVRDKVIGKIIALDTSPLKKSWFRRMKIDTPNWYTQWEKAWSENIQWFFSWTRLSKLTLCIFISAHGYVMFFCNMLSNS